MFTGIIESLGIVKSVQPKNKNIHFEIESAFTNELKVDQSVSHNGVCLTVTKINGSLFEVVAINETLQKTNLGFLKSGDIVNLERSMKLEGRIDGHLVQGHIDTTAKCKAVADENGSWLFTFEYDKGIDSAFITVEKGSICVNGVSLTVVNSKPTEFSVAIIPYTYENTNFKTLSNGSVVNLEFDIIGKYVTKYLGSIG